MRHLKLLIIVFMVILMAIPAVAGRREVKKSASALLSSGRIALADKPPRYEEAMKYFNEVIETHGMIPEAYFFRGNIFAE